MSDKKKKQKQQWQAMRDLRKLFAAAQEKPEEKKLLVDKKGIYIDEKV